jgi:PIN domain nuclease of toxin-antitoxin system
MADPLPVFVLDSFAVMAHFQAESGGEKVLELLERAGRNEVTIAMSLINVGEVAYLVSYADAFAASLTIELNGELITGDPEFKLLGKLLSLFWLE